MVYIPADLVCQMIEEVARHTPYETGGLLAGKVVSNSEWLITHITLPGANAAHGRFSYKPDYEHDDLQIANIYEATACNSVYLGDWHSHPNTASYMSEKDEQVLRTIARSKEARIPRPIMLIFGTSPLELRCWTFVKSKLLGKEFVKVPLRMLTNDKT